MSAVLRMKFYGWLHRISGRLLPGTAWNPRLLYGTLKGYWKRALREVLGVDYAPDVTSVNIAVHDISLLVCALPKVASSSFIQELVADRSLGDNVTWRPKYLGELLSEYPELDQYFKITFVRNPWARVVSVYNSHICSSTPYEVRSLFVRYPELWHGMPFEAFVRFLGQSPRGRDEVADHHWISQHRFIYDDGRLLVDRVGRLEKLDEELGRLSEQLGVEFPSLGNYSVKTTEGARTYRQWYDDTTAELVAQRYAKDISLFDYEF